jgi:hypothetical protein
MKHAKASQIRRLRGGRQLVQIADCPHCESDHWLIADGTLAYMPCGPNCPVWLDGLGVTVR